MDFKNNPSRQQPIDSLFSLQDSLQEDYMDFVPSDRSAPVSPSNDQYKQKYLHLLRKQLTIIRNQPPIIKPKITTSSQPFITKKVKKQRSVIASFLAFWATTLLVPVMIFWGVLNDSIVYGLEDNMDPIKQVAGVSESSNESSFDQPAFDEWIIEQTGLRLEASGDLDSDGLTNREEFILQSDPKNQNTCSKDKTDLENLLQLRDPKTCETIDLEKTSGLEKFAQVVHIPTLAQTLFDEDEESEIEPLSDSLYEVFGVNNLDQIDFSNNTSLQREIELSKKRDEYGEILRKIDQYISNHRSYEEFDRNYATPVGAAVFLETSIRYDVPLKYVLTIARLESRFGTDRYTRSGNLTRPGAHQNIFSIGLDDSGNNLTYGSWEEGVYAFGKWYRYFDDRGIPDCQKWRIYNPNGDYCAKVEKFAAQVQVFVYGV